LGSAPKALNHILPEVRGKRFAYSSQDDLQSVDWLGSMHARAEETGADAVLPEVVFLADNRHLKRLVGVAGDTSVVLFNREAVALSLSWEISGFALWNVEVVRRVGFHDFTFNADEFTARLLFNACNRIAFSGGTFFYRQDNPDAITKKLAPRSFEAPITNFAVYQFLVENGFDQRLCEQELIRTVSSLLFAQSELMLRGRELSPEGRQIAARHVRRGFDLLDTPEHQTAIRRALPRLGLAARLKGATILGGFAWFRLASVGVAAARRLRRR
jgi:hypothetical protein